MKIRHNKKFIAIVSFPNLDLRKTKYELSCQKCRLSEKSEKVPYEGSIRIYEEQWDATSGEELECQCERGNAATLKLVLTPKFSDLRCSNSV